MVTMPFDSLSELIVESRTVYRRRPDGGLDYDHYRRLAGQQRAQALGHAIAQGCHLIATGVGALVRGWLAYRERVRARHLLLAMDDRILRDIGISRCDAIQGAKRRLWRP